jgi:type IV secretory pathway TrbD component
MIDRNHPHYLDTKLHRAVSHRNLMRGLVYGTIGGTICWVLIFAVAWWLLR